MRELAGKFLDHIFEVGHGHDAEIGDRPGDQAQFVLIEMPQEPARQRFAHGEEKRRDLFRSIQLLARDFGCRRWLGQHGRSSLG